MTPRPEYPRPQFRRRRWVNLNGEWAFAFDDHDVGLSRGWQRTSARRLLSGRHPFGRRITVPFCHQAPLSGVDDLSPHDVVWYARCFDTPAMDPAVERLLLHFGAVDYRATVWVNGAQVAQHEGGHTPFCADVTHALRARENILIVRAEDPWSDATIPRGKQASSERPAHIFYTRTTGIWQTVWLEPVGRRRIDSLRVTPDVEGGVAEVEVVVEGFDQDLALILVVEQHGERILQQRVSPRSRCGAWRLSLTDDDGGPPPALWSPEHPNLYALHLELLDASGCILDAVDSYFGLRTIETRQGCVYLNGSPLYQRLVLDQGYYPSGLLTAPADDELRRDIELAKAMGFNGARKHQKVEDPRWLYWADRLGFLVWGEMANAYEYSLDYVQRITAEWQAVIRRDYNHPCIVVWVPINESSGGRRAIGDPLEVEHLLTMYHLTRSLDPTRLVVSNDGWEIVKSDLCTIHDYSPPDILAKRFRNLASSVTSDPEARDTHYPGFAYHGEPIIVSEFGGLTLETDGRRGWGYATVSDSGEFLTAYQALVEGLMESPVVQGFCYTQLTDVEQEVTGLLTEDRQPKADLARIRMITEQATRLGRELGQSETA
ncbi:MAG: glycoside hydrolase family 2 [Chloroflexi bacterium]|nr:glycoside hydrolase family 2 [Chloroflexota bacterium]